LTSDSPPPMSRTMLGAATLVMVAFDEVERLGDEDDDQGQPDDLGRRRETSSRSSRRNTSGCDGRSHALNNEKRVRYEQESQRTCSASQVSRSSNVFATIVL
jgi:hypothetical protein